MSTRSTSKELWIAAGFGLLLAATVGSYWRLSGRIAAAGVAAENLASCEQLAAQIVRLRDRPERVALEAQSATALASRLEQAATSAQIPQTQIVRIDPQPSRRIGETSYREQPTHLEVRWLTMQQLVTFLHALAASRPKLESRQIRLTAPRTEAPRGESPGAAPTQEAWQADVTLTSLIYSPKGAGK